MLYEGNMLEKPYVIANDFADFFSKCDSPTLPDIQSDFAFNLSMLNILGFLEAEVVEAFKQVKHKITTSPDDILDFILKECASVLFSKNTPFIFASKVVPYQICGTYQEFVPFTKRVINLIFGIFVLFLCYV